MTTPHATLDVGFDLDGVLYPLVPALRHYAHTHHGIPLADLPDPTVYDFGPQWGMTGVGFLQLMHDAVDAGVLFRHGHPTQGAAEVTHRLRDAGHRVHIKTSRFLGANPAAAAEATEWWLLEHGIHYDTLLLTRDKTAGAACHAYLDDLPAHYDAVAATGTFAVLMDATYNQDPSPRRRRVHTLTEYADLIDRLAVRLHARLTTHEETCTHA